MIQKYFNGNVRQQIRQRAGQFGIKGQEALDVLITTKNTVKEVLQAEIKNGQYDEVLALLKNATLKTGKQLFFDKIIQRVVGRLILRFGLPHSVAFTLATLLVPYILKHLGRKVLKNGKVQDLLNTVGVTNQLQKLKNLQNRVTGNLVSGKKSAA